MTEFKQDKKKYYIYVSKKVMQSQQGIKIKNKNAMQQKGPCEEYNTI